jgi:hypothetical protein
LQLLLVVLDAGPLDLGLEVAQRLAAPSWAKWRNGRSSLCPSSVKAAMRAASLSEEPSLS